jgi:hypothetical protein
MAAKAAARQHAGGIGRPASVATQRLTVAAHSCAVLCACCAATQVRYTRPYDTHGRAALRYYSPRAHAAAAAIAARRRRHSLATRPAAGDDASVHQSSHGSGLW